MSGGKGSSFVLLELPLSDLVSIDPAKGLEGLSHGGFWRFPPSALRGVVEVKELAVKKGIKANIIKL